MPVVGSVLTPAVSASTGLPLPVGDRGTDLRVDAEQVAAELTIEHVRAYEATLANVQEEIQSAENRLAEISQSADEAMSNQDRDIQPATFCCRFARVGSCRWHANCRYIHERAARLWRCTQHGMQLQCDRILNHGECYHIDQQEHP